MFSTAVTTVATPNPFKVDVLIMGGGIAGLWTLAHLQRAGYSALLLEKAALGAGQTIASQGIIHSGIKYALGGEASRASRAIAAMPGIWRDCLAGTGKVDLRRVRVLSERQYLWTTSGLLSRVAALGASKVMRTGGERLSGKDRPAAFAEAPRGVDVYSVDEPVLDPHSVIEALAAQVGADARTLPAGTSLKWKSVSGRIHSVCVMSERETLVIEPAAVVLSAGAGNAELMQAMGYVPGEERVPFQQLRPLHMVMMAWVPELMFAHCLGASNVPRLTITTGVFSNKEDKGKGWRVWYIGGAIAETGVQRSERDQIQLCKKEIQECLPWMKLERVLFATCRLDRVEGVSKLQTPPARPDEPTIARLGNGNVVVGWPTKLAFAPVFAGRVGELIREIGVEACERSEKIPEHLLPDSRRVTPTLGRWNGRWQEREVDGDRERVMDMSLVTFRRPLGATGMHVSPIGLGTVKLGRNSGVKYPAPFELPSDADATALLRTAHELGINLIDTAPAYGVSEERLGAIMHANAWFGGRDAWVLSTKAGEEFDPASGESRFDFSPKAIRASVERSLRRLRTDVLDVVLAHSDGRDEWVLLASGAMDELRRLKREGKVRAFGASTKTVDGGLMAVRGGESACDVVMVTLNARERADAMVIQAAARRNIGVVVKKGLLSGHLSEAAARLPEHRRDAGDPVEESLRLIWAVGGEGVASTIVGTINVGHLRSDAAAMQRVMEKA